MKVRTIVFCTALAICPLAHGSQKKKSIIPRNFRNFLGNIQKRESKTSDTINPINPLSAKQIKNIKKQWKKQNNGFEDTTNLQNNLVLPEVINCIYKNNPSNSKNNMLETIKKKLPDCLNQAILDIKTMKNLYQNQNGTKNIPIGRMQALYTKTLEHFYNSHFLRPQQKKQNDSLGGDSLIGNSRNWDVIPTTKEIKPTEVKPQTPTIEPISEEKIKKIWDKRSKKIDSGYLGARQKLIKRITIELVVKSIIKQSKNYHKAKRNGLRNLMEKRVRMCFKETLRTERDNVHPNEKIGAAFVDTLKLFYDPNFPETIKIPPYKNKA